MKLKIYTEYSTLYGESKIWILRELAGEVVTASSSIYFIDVSSIVKVRVISLSNLDLCNNVLLTCMTFSWPDDLWRPHPICRYSYKRAVVEYILNSMWSQACHI